MTFKRVIIQFIIDLGFQTYLPGMGLNEIVIWKTAVVDKMKFNAVRGL